MNAREDIRGPSGPPAVSEHIATGYRGIRFAKLRSGVVRLRRRQRLQAAEPPMMSAATTFTSSLRSMARTAAVLVVLLQVSLWIARGLGIFSGTANPASIAQPGVAVLLVLLAVAAVAHDGRWIPAISGGFPSPCAHSHHPREHRVGRPARSHLRERAASERSTHGRWAGSWRKCIEPRQTRWPARCSSESP